MKAFLCLTLLLAVSQAMAEECLGYSSSVELRGMLRSETFPGPPNYESVAAGDRAETYFFVVPAAPLCVRQGDASGLEPAAAGVGKLQLIFFDSSAYGKLRPSLGKEVRCTGKLMGAHTGRHHSEVLLTGSKCNAAQPIFPSERSRQAAPSCGSNAEGSAAYLKAADIVRSLPEFQSWSKSHNNPVAFGAPMDKEVLLKGLCYWSVSVFADRKERLAPWHTFFVRPSSKSILVEDPVSGEPISLAAWRAKNTLPTAKP